MDAEKLEKKLTSHGWTETESGCWEWNGYRLPEGYGQVTESGLERRAHRIAHIVWIGPIPPGHVVMHTCDNPPCINPAHLKSGTHADNTADKMTKGRSNHPTGPRTH